MSKIQGLFKDHLEIFLKNLNSSLAGIPAYNVREGKRQYMKIEYEVKKTGFIQASMSKIQGLFKDFSSLSNSFHGLKSYEKY